MLTVVVRDEVTPTLGAQVTERIKDLSHEQGISGRELGRRLGKSHGWLSGLYAGRQPYDLDDLAAIARELGTSAERLLGIRPSSLPPAVQRIVDWFAESVMAFYEHRSAGAAERRALLRIIRESWRRGPQRDMEYWRREIELPPQREASHDTTPSRPRTRS